MVVYGSVSAARAAVDVLANASRPMNFAELQQEVGRLLGRSVKPHSLRAAIYYHLRGNEPWFHRLGRGVYVLSEAGRELVESDD